MNETPVYELQDLLQSATDLGKSISIVAKLTESHSSKLSKAEHVELDSLESTCHVMWICQMSPTGPLERRLTICYKVSRLKKLLL
jgi:hypothetical protein